MLSLPWRAESCSISACNLFSDAADSCVLISISSSFLFARSYFCVLPWFSYSWPTPRGETEAGKKVPFEPPVLFHLFRVLLRGLTELPSSLFLLWVFMLIVLTIFEGEPNVARAFVPDTRKSSNKSLFELALAWGLWLWSCFVRRMLSVVTFFFTIFAGDRCYIILYLI